jgi:hypothetical protein
VTPWDDVQQTLGALLEGQDNIKDRLGTVEGRVEDLWMRGNHRVQKIAGGTGLAGGSVAVFEMLRRLVL